MPSLILIRHSTPLELHPCRITSAPGSTLDSEAAMDLQRSSMLYNKEDSLLFYY